MKLIWLVIKNVLIKNALFRPNSSGLIRDLSANCCFVILHIIYKTSIIHTELVYRLIQVITRNRFYFLHGVCGTVFQALHYDLTGCIRYVELTIIIRCSFRFDPESNTLQRFSANGILLQDLQFGLNVFCSNFCIDHTFWNLSIGFDLNFVGYITDCISFSGCYLFYKIFTKVQDIIGNGHSIISGCDCGNDAAIRKSIINVSFWVNFVANADHLECKSCTAGLASFFVKLFYCDVALDCSIFHSNTNQNFLIFLGNLKRYINRFCVALRGLHLNKRIFAT